MTLVKKSKGEDMSICENCGETVSKRRKGYKELEGKMVCKPCQKEVDNKEFSDMCDIIMDI